MSERPSERESPWWAKALALGVLSTPRAVPVVVGALFAAVAVRTALEPFGDQDAPWIAAAGRQLLASGVIPRTNGWSITDAAEPWVMHEWALGPLYAAMMSSLGLAGAVVIGLAAAAVTASLLAQATIGRARHLGAGALACVAAIALARECLVEPRPAYVTLGLPLAALLLADAPRMPWGRALALVGLEAVWANVHGSFPLGLALMGLGVGIHREDRPARITALGLATLATLATPYGLSLLALVDRYVRGGDDAAAAIHAHIAEFQPLWAAGSTFGSAPRVLAVVLVAALAGAGLARGERGDRLRALLALLLAGLAVLHARHVPQAVVLGAPLLVPVLDRLVDAAKILDEVHARSALVVRVSAACACVSIAAATLACVRGVHADDALGGEALPSLAHDPRAAGRPTYVPFDAAGRFVWLASPDARVFFDPRNDCYRAETALAAYAIEEGDCTGACIVRTLDQAGVEVAIVPIGDDRDLALAASTRYQPVRDEGDWRLYRAR